jgi:hypothetical protein
MNSIMPSEPHDARVSSSVDTRLRAEDGVLFVKGSVNMSYVVPRSSILSSASRAVEHTC